MSKLLKLLLSLISARFGDGDEEESQPEDDLQPDEEQVEEPDKQDEEPSEEESEEEAKPIGKREREIITLRERAQAAEAAKTKLESDLEAARRPQNTQKSEDQRIWEQEQAVLNDAEASDWQKYAVSSAREARQANRNSTAALQEAKDLTDKAKFDQFAITKPKLYTTYKDEVETRLKEFREQGGNPSREQVLALIVGEAMVTGKLKTSDSPKKPANRQAPPNTRSDVSSSGRSGMSDADKREKRLENVLI